MINLILAMEAHDDFNQSNVSECFVHPLVIPWLTFFPFGNRYGYINHSGGVYHDWIVCKHNQSVWLVKFIVRIDCARPFYHICHRYSLVGHCRPPSGYGGYPGVTDVVMVNLTRAMESHDDFNQSNLSECFVHPLVTPWVTFFRFGNRYGYESHLGRYISWSNDR